MNAQFIVLSALIGGSTSAPHQVAPPFLTGFGPHHLHLKLTVSTDVRLPDGLPVGDHAHPELEELRSFLAWERLTLEPLVDDEVARTLGERARAASTQPTRLAAMFRLRAPERSDADRLELARYLAQSSVVEWVRLEPASVPPPHDYAPATPHFESEQRHLGGAPGVGIELARAAGFDGRGIRIFDCEYDWMATHEDLVGQALYREPFHTPVPAIAEHGWHHHGTAVAGVIAAEPNDYGVVGISPGVELHLYSELTVEGGSRRVGAIAAAAAAAQPGDVVLIEMQTIGRPEGSFGPAELHPGVWEVTRAAVDAGVVVVAAAGNGGEDLDDEAYREYRERGDSGAIIVGAGSSDGRHERCEFSTFGERVDVQAWGEDLVTTGYGSLKAVGDDPLQSYATSFGGTSGAAAVVAAVSAVVQQAARTLELRPLSGPALRALLRDTGRWPSDQDGRVGPHPSLALALRELGVVPLETPEVTIVDRTPTAWSPFDITVADVGHGQIDFRPVLDVAPPASSPDRSRTAPAVRASSPQLSARSEAPPASGAGCQGVSKPACCGLVLFVFAASGGRRVRSARRPTM